MRRLSPPRRRLRAAVLTLASASLVVLALGSLAAPAAAQPASIDRDDAIAIVTQTQLGGSLDGVRLYVLPRSLSAGEAIADWKRDVFVAPAGGWLVFVDRYPGANWEHPCWYFFVDATSGEVRRFDSSTPPSPKRSSAASSRNSAVTASGTER